MTRLPEQTDIKDLLKEEFEGLISRLPAEPFRAGQILEWVYKKGQGDFDRMSNLSGGLRTALKKWFYISGLELAKRSDSNDGTIKYLFDLEDGQRIESVLIPSARTTTVCVSSQVGCKHACGFCASGKKGFSRDLRPAEMVNQPLYIRKTTPFTNIVFMGMGEPLDNYANVLKAARIMNAGYGLGIGQRKITISSCGLIPQIEMLSREGLQIELSISLHSADDAVRSRLMPVNRRYPVKALVKACRDYAKRTNRQVTFEYLLIRGINDSDRDARALALLLKGMLAKVNLISFNPVEGFDYMAPDPGRAKAFKEVLDKNAVIATLRRSRGADIEAACGQLRLKYDKE